MICLKNHGYFIFAARYSYLGEYWYANRLAELEKAGRLRFISSQAYFKYDTLNHAIGRFSRTPAKVYIYQKTEEDSMTGYKKMSSQTVSTVASEDPFA